jgi:hypothetical protein
VLSVNKADIDQGPVYHRVSGMHSAAYSLSINGHGLEFEVVLRLGLGGEQ